MYVTKVQLENIRSIKKFEMNFPKPAGWHVIIGDNGSGKTSVLRAVGFGLLPKGQRAGLRIGNATWLRKQTVTGMILLEFEFNKKFDSFEVLESNTPIYKKITFSQSKSVKIYNNDEKAIGIFDDFDRYILISNFGITEKEVNDWDAKGSFSVGFGPFRRFSGGTVEQKKINDQFPRLAAHLSLFGEDVALTEALDWIRVLDYERLKDLEYSQVQESRGSSVYENLKLFINKSQLLPHGITLNNVEKNGIVFVDANKNRIETLELSDGYRSILSLMFELIRQLVQVYGSKAVFKEVQKGDMVIDLPGVVLIDEIDAHLHPSWQSKIGFWFTKYFPSLQFIVTTHSPLVCRACENGSIWRLARPGSETESGEITGVDRDRLIFGNVLDAYGTELFGRSVDQSEKSLLLQKEIADLNKKSFKGTISNEEKARMFELKKILPTAK